MNIIKLVYRNLNGSGDTRKGVCLCMSVAELMERIGVNEVLMYVSVLRISHLSLTSLRLGYLKVTIVYVYKI